MVAVSTRHEWEVAKVIIFQGFWERQKNPWGWLHRVLWAVVFYVAVWEHAPVFIVVSIIGIAITMLFFPEHKSPPAYAGRLVSAAKRLMSAPWETPKYAYLAFMSVLFIVILYALWTHMLWLSVGLIVLGIVVKLSVLYWLSRGEPEDEGQISGEP